MKNILKMLGIIGMVAVIGFSMAACDNVSESQDRPDPNTEFNFSFTTDLDETVTAWITSYKGKGGDVTIPSEYDGKPITEINGFENCIGLTSVSIPSSVKIIWGGTFKNCSNLTKINIPSRVTKIGDEAFFYCESLKYMDLPDSVTSIGKSAFGFCKSLTSITIPDSINIIEKKTFSNCTGLTSVTMGRGVTEIGEEAFQSCTSLTSVTIPPNVKVIGKSAFYLCSNLTSVTFVAGSNITDGSFGIMAFPETLGGGDSLKNAYAIGKAGTYKRAANGDTWTKQ